MENKDLFEKLNTIKNDIKPDQEWKNSNRDILFSQISNFEPLKMSLKEALIEKIKFFSHFVIQPVSVISLIVLFSIGVWGHKITSNVKPNNSLYIARIISEKAQLAIVFDKIKKAELELKFANNRAKDISSVLVEKNIKNEDKEKLVSDFKKEIKIVKNNLKQIQKKKKNTPKIETQKIQNNNNDKNKNNNDNIVFSAGLSKEKQGLSISELNNNINVDKNSSSSPEIDENINQNNINIDKLVNEAEKLFKNEDYKATIDKLNEVEAVLGNDNNSQKENTQNILSASSTDK